MSTSDNYTITLRVYQANPKIYFRPVEKTIWRYANGSKGTWTESMNGEHVLTMGGSGSCGALRFMSDTGENVVVAVGVHNSKPWCDIVQDLKKEDTGSTIQAEYYGGGRDSQREKQLTTYTATSASGRKVSIEYSVVTGKDLKANITFEKGA